MSNLGRITYWHKFPKVQENEINGNAKCWHTILFKAHLHIHIHTRKHACAHKPNESHTTTKKTAKIRYFKILYMRQCKYNLWNKTPQKLGHQQLKQMLYNCTTIKFEEDYMNCGRNRKERTLATWRLVAFSAVFPVASVDDCFQDPVLVSEPAPLAACQEFKNTYVISNKPYLTNHNKNFFLLQGIGCQYFTTKKCKFSY